ncbi:hypothetical protein [Gracilibacillus thailandensis]|uniref:Uncharacterized protein n=1 Tax=Gracilibacillus thailandensis TaxID=563735 RepID=A0A6N7QSQ2_9BACI|nr:hypothetical protein [Gracilibacillus thailandensis]MRI65147.1 hypothetical protein [Gracilibacillus thailandensis]
MADKQIQTLRSINYDPDVDQIIIIKKGEANRFKPTSGFGKLEAKFENSRIQYCDKTEREK